MLPTLSKLPTVQIITTTTLIIIITLLSSLCSTTESLPITSKPIESTAENLAWEAWLMVPVGQQQKSRKVTPKSIFIVPHKKNQTSSIQCPPGEHIFESRCIPTVNIDTEKILLTQLTNLVLTSGDYDYDYDEEGNDTPGAEKLEGDSDLIPSSSVDKVDEPLKFDIFRDNFPIGSSGSGDSSGSKDTEDEGVFFIGERRRRPPTPPEIAPPDLDTDSTSYGLHKESAEEGGNDPDEESTLFLSGIDAILVPATSQIQGNEQNLNISVYHDVINATTVKSEVEVLTPIAEKKVDLEQILKDELLFLDKEHEVEEKDITTTEKVETTTDIFEEETTTMKLEEDEDVESKTEFTRSVTEVIPMVEETTSTPPSDSTEISSMSTLMAEEERDITTTMITNEETTIISDSKEELTTITNSNEGTTIHNPDLEATGTNSNLKDRSTESNRFLYHRIRDEKPPPVIDIQAELKMINELVAKKRQASQTTTTTQTPSVEITPKSSDLWAKIIPSSPNAIDATSVIPLVQSSSSSTIGSSTSTSSNILSNSSSSSSSTVTASTTDSQGSQGSFTDSSSPTSSTQPGQPALAQSDPFWWLPNGWRVDGTDADRPLLLRFWSALSGFSGSQTKV